MFGVENTVFLEAAILVVEMVCGVCAMLLLA
jgi:hypothetical protein